MKPDGSDAIIAVESSNVDLGDVLPDKARDSIRRVAGKYFGHLNTAAVHFRREGSSYHCTVNLQMGALKTVTAEASDADCYKAFDAALDRAAKQLRRMKRALREDKALRTDKDLVLREGLRGS